MENVSRRRFLSFAFETTTSISLSFKLVPVQCRGFEYGLYICRVGIPFFCSLSLFFTRFCFLVDSIISFNCVCLLAGGNVVYYLRVRLLQGKSNASYVFNVCRQSLTNDFCASIKIVASLKFDYTDLFYCILKILSSKILSNVFSPVAAGSD